MRDQSLINNLQWSNERQLIKADAYIAGAQFNYIWTSWERAEFRRLWDAGKGLMYLANYFDRRWEEIFILAADLVDKGKIKDRERPLFS